VLIAGAEVSGVGACWCLLMPVDVVVFAAAVGAGDD
jgi:hypothetical protein